MKKKLTNRQREYQKFLQSHEWAKIRCDMLIIHNHSCQLCGGKKNLQVYHLNYSKPWGEEDPEDLILTCAKCHHSEHGGKQRKRRRHKKKKCVKKQKVKTVVKKRVVKVRKNK